MYFEYKERYLPRMGDSLDSLLVILTAVLDDVDVRDR